MAMKMDSRSPLRFKAGRTPVGKLRRLQIGTKLAAKSVSEVFPVVSEVWTSTIR